MTNEEKLVGEVVAEIRALQFKARLADTLAEEVMLLNCDAGELDEGKCRHLRELAAALLEIRND